MPVSMQFCSIKCEMLPSDGQNHHKLWSNILNCQVKHGSSATMVGNGFSNSSPGALIRGGALIFTKGP